NGCCGVFHAAHCSQGVVRSAAPATPPRETISAMTGRRKVVFMRSSVTERMQRYRMTTGTLTDKRQDCFHISRADETVSFDASSLNDGRCPDGVGTPGDGKLPGQSSPPSASADLVPLPSLTIRVALSSSLRSNAWAVGTKRSSSTAERFTRPFVSPD